MKISRSLFLKLVLCSGIGLLITAPDVHAATTEDVQAVLDDDGKVTSEEEAAVLGVVNDDIAGFGKEDLDALMQVGVDAIKAAEGKGGGSSTTQAIMTAILDKAFAVGAAPNQIDAIKGGLVAASSLQNAATLGDNAKSASSGPNSQDMTRRSFEGSGDVPVPTGTAAGGNSLTLPAGCSSGDLKCIADGNGLTVEQVQERLANGAVLTPP